MPESEPLISLPFLKEWPPTPADPALKDPGAPWSALHSQRQEWSLTSLYRSYTRNIPRSFTFLFDEMAQPMTSAFELEFLW